MRKLYFVTTNPGKVASAERHLNKFGIKIAHCELAVDEIQDLSIAEVARKKAKTAFTMIKKPCFVVDAGLVIPALKGFPGAFTKHVLNSVGLDGLSRLIIPGSKIHFEDVLVFTDGQVTKVFKELVEGSFVEKRGKLRDYYWSPLFLVFRPQGETQTLAEMPSEYFKKWSRQREKNSMWEKFGRWYVESVDNDVVDNFFGLRGGSANEKKS